MLLISVSAYKQAGAEWKEGTASQSDEDASSLPSFPAAFPRLRGPDKGLLCGVCNHKMCGVCKQKYVVFVNKAPALRNSKSGFRCAMEELISKSVFLS